MTAVGGVTAHAPAELVAAGATLVIEDFARLTWDDLIDLCPR
jgi:hypothetical protein